MKKLLFGLALTAALLVMVTGTVFAQETVPPLSGEVQSVTIETDSTTGTTTVVVTLVDELGDEHTVRIGLQTAVDLGLVELEPTYVVVDIPEGTVVEVSLESDEILEEITEEETEDESLHPVGSALSDFFTKLLGVDYDVIMAAHEGGEEGSGVGFGVIAQALWMTQTLKGDPDDTANADYTELFKLILQAKTDGTYSDVTLPDGTLLTLSDGSAPTNWGQFKQAVQSLTEEEKEKNNLGSIKSGHEDDETTTDLDLESTRPDKGNKDKDKDKGKGKNKQP